MTDSRRFTVLVVEDYPDTRAVLRRVVARLGVWDMLEAETGEIGVDLALSSDPDLVLLDYLLPGINGNEVLHQIRSNPATRHLPVWILTADSSEQLEMRFQRGGATGYLAKPLNFPDLISVFNGISGLE